jgi:hypothetical protein
MPSRKDRISQCARRMRLLLIGYLFTQHDASLGRPTKSLEKVDMKTAQHQQYIEEVKIRNGAMKTAIE